VVLRATNWSIAEIATHSGQETLLQADILPVIGLEITAAEQRHRQDIATILRIYQDIFRWCQEEKNISAAYQRAREKLELESVYLWWAKVHRSQREYAAALPKVNRAIELAPQSPQGLIERGWIYRGIGQYQQALNDFDHALKLNDSFRAQAYLGRGAICLELGELQMARHSLDEAIRLEPSYAYHFHWRGCVRAEQKDLVGALDDFNVAIRLNERDYAHAYWHALVQLDMQNIEAALHEFELLCEYESDRPQEYAYDQVWRGFALHLLERQDEAQEAWKLAVQGIQTLAEGSPRKMVSALAAAVCGRIDEAMRHYEQVIGVHHPPHIISTHLHHLRLIVRLQSSRPDLQQAVRSLEQLIQGKKAVPVEWA
jgi:tetratricopeptide (TPR) repeat protein